MEEGGARGARVGQGQGMTSGIFVFAVLVSLCRAAPCGAQQTRAPIAGSGTASVPADSTPKSKPRDSLFGLDKPKHFLMCAFVQSVGFSALEAAGGRYSTDATGAAVVTASVAFGKEIHDRRTTGLFSFGDLLWDAAGAVAAGAMLRHTHR